MGIKITLSTTYCGCVCYYLYPELYYFKLLHHLVLPVKFPPYSSSAAPPRGSRTNKHIVAMFGQSKREIVGAI